MSTTTSSGQVARIERIWNDFAANMSALHAFSVSIGGLADERDKAAVANFESGIADACPEMATFMSTLSKLAQDETFQAIQSRDMQSDYIRETPEARALFGALSEKSTTVRLARVFSSQQMQPQNGAILRRGVLNSAVGFFEWMEADLFRLHLDKYPGSLETERSLSLVELRRAETMENAISILIEAEVDEFTRKDFLKRQRATKKLFSIDDAPLLPLAPAAHEVIQRRHVVVHNKCIANRQYLDSIEALPNGDNPPAEGTHLNVSREYLEQALSALEAYGVVLLQQYWRKHYRTEPTQFSERLHRHLYELLLRNREGQIVLLSKYATGVPREADDVRRMNIINICIAHKRLGQSDKIDSLLDEHDWSACAVKFQLALEILRRGDRIDQLLKDALACKALDVNNVEEWPLFEDLRASGSLNWILQEKDAAIPEES